MNVTGLWRNRDNRISGARAVISLALVIWVATAAVMTSARGASGATALRTATETHASSIALNGKRAADLSNAREVASKRTAHSDTFELPDGLRETRIYEAPVNHRTPNGGYKPVMEGFAESSASFEDRSGLMKVHVPSELGGPVRVGGPKHWISFEALETEKAAAHLDSDGVVTYQDVQAGTTFEYATLPNGVKETIELDSVSSPSTVRYRLTVAQGVTPDLARNGSIVFRDADGQGVARIPAPTVTEAGSAIPISPPASYALSPTEKGAWSLTVKVNRSWLEQPGRSWPVRIDPTLLTLEAGIEHFCQLVSTGSERSSYCDPQDLSLEAADTESPGEGGYRTRTLMRFGIGSIPAGSEIQEASVNLYARGAYPSEGGSGVELRRVTQEWRPGGANWVCAAESGGNPCESRWSAAGGTFNSEGSVLLTADQKNGGGPGWWTFTNGITPLVQSWVSNGQNYGLLLKLAGFEKPWQEWNGVGPYSPETTKRPYMKVVYLPRAPFGSRVISPWEGQRTARRLKLQAAWASAGVEGVTFEYREGKTGQFQTIPSSLLGSQEGKSVSWPVRVGFEERATKPIYLDAAHLTPNLRKRGGIVQIRAVFEGPREVAGFSAPVESVVDRAMGSPTDATAPVGPGSVDLLTGNFSMSRSDFAIPTYNSTLGVSRSFNSRRPPMAKGSEEELAELTSPLGPGWSPSVPLEEAGATVWKNLRIVEEKGTFDQFEWSFAYALVSPVEGGQIAFEKNENGSFSAPPELAGWSLISEAGGLVLTDPAGTRTKFTNPGGGSEYVPTTILEAAGGAATQTEIEYEVPKAGVKRLHMIVAPPPPGASCTSQTEATGNPACKALIFHYQPATTWGAPAADGERLGSISFYAPGNAAPVEVARYEYNAEGRLVAEWDPRLSSPLKETYSYNTEGGLKTVKPAGEEPWSLEYGTYDEEEIPARLIAIKRPSLLASPTTAQTSIVYDVPVSGGPYELSPASVAQWGQKDVPVAATAIFPPDQVPTARPPSTYSHATVYYTDYEGREVNTATPSPTGSGVAISTSEKNVFGDIVRELTPRNRNTAMAESTEARKIERAALLETRRKFNASGTQMEEEIGPLHSIHLDSGSSAFGRFHRVVQYDRRPEGVPLPSPDPNLPTRETTGAWVEGVLKDERITETEYDWKLRAPTKQITVMGPGKANIEKSTAYNDTTGLAIERRQPSNVQGAGPATTRLVYYAAGSGAGCETAIYYGLLCKTEPAEQPRQVEGLPAQPKLLVKRITLYNALYEPTTITESPEGEAGNVRKTSLRYDSIGRPTTKKVEGGGTAVPTTETVYSSSTGAVVRQQFACEGCATEPNITSYNAIGQVTEYEDADGNKTKHTYDVDGRPATVSDGKATQTYRYAEASGMLTKIEDSGIGTVTASYNADGDLTERGLPNGLTAKTNFNEVDEPTGLVYTKTSSCGESCTWYEEVLERSIFGQVVGINGSLAHNRYSYDHAGRLIESQETPVGGQCVTRLYGYDADSNRLSRTTRQGAGVCATSGGTVQNYRYDSADRLNAPGMVYDAWGRISSLPAEFGGGKALTTAFFSDDMVASQSQNGVTNSYELDASLRQRQRVQAGGVSGTEVFHYDGPGDSPSWTALGSTWTRNVLGFAGELIATQESSGATSFALTNLHGDVVAKASSSAAATKLLATFRFDEFGESEAGSSGRFGWLGADVRRTELASGVIQMGARSYVPEMGRFLSTDADPGGSANAYDYVNQDPVNSIDLAGAKPYQRLNDTYIEAGAHMWSPTNIEGAHISLMFIRFYVRLFGTSNTTSDNTETYTRWKFERMDTGEVISERTVYPPNVITGNVAGRGGEEGVGYNNWQAGTPPLMFLCHSGVQYKFWLALYVKPNLTPADEGIIEIEEECNHGPY